MRLVRLGAPQATQVADRWHLLHNLVEVLEELLLQHRPTLRQAAEAPRAAPADAELRADAAPPTEAKAAPAPPERYQGRRRCSQARQERLTAASRRRHERVVEQYEAIRRLHAAGADVADIARTVGVSRRTVYRYRELAEPPPPKQPRRRQQVLDPYVPYLLRRWAEGCHNGMRLYREIAAQGFASGPSSVSRFVAQLRRDQAAGQPLERPRRAARVPTARQVSALFLRRTADLTAEQRAYLERLRTLEPALATAYQLTQDFATLVRERQGERLDAWLAAARAAEASALQRFAVSLGEDLAAVRAGVTEPWSNGPTEGFVHKLKLLKRQGYGRAGVTLLRRRLLDIA
jgi:transposase